MLIVKYCPKKYHISTTETIQIGTLNYYKKSDNLFIADPFEGHHEHIIEDSHKTIKIQRDETVKISDGRLSASLTINPGGKLELESQFPNVYIFCCSLVERPSIGHAKSISDEYDAFYIVNDPNGFMQLVEQQLRWLFRPADKKPRKIKMLHAHGGVKYVDHRSTSYGQADPDRQIATLDHIFTKPRTSPVAEHVAFEANQEYRFAWVGLDEQDYIVPVEDEPIYVRTNPFSFVTSY